MFSNSIIVWRLSHESEYAAKRNQSDSQKTTEKREISNKVLGSPAQVVITGVLVP